MSTELDTIRPGDLNTTTGNAGANLIREAAAVMVDAHKLATAVAGTQMIPRHFQGKPDECAAAMLYGASLGLDPMQSVRQIYVVHGQAALYARAMVALVLGAGHEVWTVESTDQSVTVAARRKGASHVEQVTWTYERANRAGYTNNAKYKTDPQAMLYSKAASEVCRKIAPDVLSGVYAVEEMQMERVESEQVAPRGLAALLPPSPSPAPGGLAPEPAVDDAAPVEVPPQDVQQRAGEDSDDGITPGQLKKLGALMREAGIVDRGGALAYVGDVIGREVASRNELTKAEAGRVIDALEVDMQAADVPEDNFGSDQ